MNRSSNDESGRHVATDHRTIVQISTQFRHLRSQWKTTIPSVKASDVIRIQRVSQVHPRATDQQLRISPAERFAVALDLEVSSKRSVEIQVIIAMTERVCRSTARKRPLRQRNPVTASLCIWNIHRRPLTRRPVLSDGCTCRRGWIEMRRPGGQRFELLVPDRPNVLDALPPSDGVKPDLHTEGGMICAGQYPICKYVLPRSIRQRGRSFADV